MKLWFTSDNVAWDAGRYRYPAEQMMLTLFPGERPEYPPGAPPASLTETNAVIFTLHRGKKLTNMSALVFRGPRRQNGVVRFSSALLDAPEEEVYHTLSHALKEAFYRAGTALLGHELPWGSLTGVRPTKLPTRALLRGEGLAGAERELKTVYHVSPPRRRLALECAQASVKAQTSLQKDEISLYVGIPFCPTRCAYCSFVSADVGKSLKLVEPYLEALFREIAAAGALLAREGLHVRTVYIGGGTPTTLGAGQLTALMKELRARIDLSRCTEYTVEAGRPDTITAEKLEAICSGGAGRVSVNPQSMDDRVLAAIGRDHTAEDILRAMELVRAAGIGSVNMDLIAGLPGDSPAGFAASLEAVVALGAENVTVHTLALKKGSRLMAGEESGGALPSGSEVAGMLSLADAALRKAGYAPYYLYRQKYMSGAFENVGWCLPGRESLYNICMMEELHTVLALGGGGVSKLVDPAAGRIRRLTAPKYPNEYIAGIDAVIAGKEELSTFYRQMEGRQDDGLSAPGDQ